MRTVKLSKYLTEQNRHRVLKARGLPFNCTDKDICDFFEDYNIVIGLAINEYNDTYRWRAMWLSRLLMERRPALELYSSLMSKLL
jgi:hypothetical protein